MDSVDRFLDVQALGMVCRRKGMVLLFIGELFVFSGRPIDAHLGVYCRVRYYRMWHLVSSIVPPGV